MARQLKLLPACAVVALLSACGGGPDADKTDRKPAEATPAATLEPVATQAPSDSDQRTDDVMVDVGGHDMIVACRGSGSPTVIYIHGMGGLGRGAVEISDKLRSPRPRYCGYDRPNGLGISETQDGPLTGKGSVEDLHALLAAADVPPRPSSRRALQGDEPAVPVTDIAVKRLDLPASYPRKAIKTSERKMQREFVGRFSPGRLIFVDTDQYMEPVIPGRIARDVERVIAAAAER
jgi:hypothetical protein